MIAKIAGWTAVTLSVLILLAFTVIRIKVMYQDAPSAEMFDVRYVRHPGLALWHMVPGVLFLTLAPLQFITRIRRRHLELHRKLGWLLTLAALASGLAAFVLNVRFPAFGGISTQSATVFFGVIFLFSLAKSIYHVKRREIALHREWMIRTFALALGVATIRVFIVLFQVFSDLRFHELFGTTFWLGFGVNLLIAEIWINHTRRRPVTG